MKASWEGPQEKDFINTQKTREYDHTQLTINAPHALQSDAERFRYTEKAPLQRAVLNLPTIP